MMEKIVVSGSNGFIGKHLSEHLEQFGPMGRDGELPEGLTVLFDLASYGNMSDQKDVWETYRANLLRVTEENDYIGNAKWIYISTSSVMLPIQTPYSLSKKSAEEFLKYTGKKVAIVRPFTIVGVGEQKEHLIPKLIDSCLHGTEMPFVKESVHDFLDVEDFCDALLTIKDKAQFEGEIYEVGSGKQISNDEIRLLIEEVTGKKANLKIVDGMRTYDSKNWVANNERISTLGWEPKHTLLDTLKEMVEAER